MHRFKQWCVLGVCLAVLSVSLSGCEPLRKKFTRKKKADKKEKFIPVLEPVDYPPSRVSSLEQYKYHFSLWQVWNKEMGQLADDPNTDKRLDYLYEQIIQELEEMKRW